SMNLVVGLLPTMFSVTNTGDNGGINPAPFAGTGTLRQAIIDANALPNAAPSIPDQISFAIPGVGPFTIHLTSALPTITDPVSIQGYTQAGAQVNRTPIGL